jgi:hypothetical protein
MFFGVKKGRKVAREREGRKEGSSQKKSIYHVTIRTCTFEVGFFPFSEREREFLFALPSLTMSTKKAVTPAATAVTTDDSVPKASLVSRHSTVFIIVMGGLGLVALALLILYLSASSKVTTLTDQNSAIATQMITLNTQNAALAAQNTTATTQNTTDATQNTALTAQLAQATTANSAQMDTIASLNAQISDQQTSYANTIASVQKVSDLNNFISGVYMVVVPNWNGAYNILTVVLSFVSTQQASATDDPCVYMTAYIPPVAGTTTAPTLPLLASNLTLAQGGSTYNTSQLWFTNTIELNADWTSDDGSTYAFSVQSQDGVFTLSSTDGIGINLTGTFNVSGTGALGAITGTLPLVTAPLVRVA